MLRIYFIIERGSKMAYGDYWKAVSKEDATQIQEWIQNHDYEQINTECIDVAYLLFGDKYGAQIKLVEWGAAEPSSDEQGTYHYINSDDEVSTIEYHLTNDEKVQKLANDMAQNHWRYARNLIPSYSTITYEDYCEQLSNAGYLDF